MTKRKKEGLTKQRFIDETLAFINENGGSERLNLREIARRVGCAHTNAYHYFSDLKDLKWAALEAAVLQYAEAISGGLENEMDFNSYFDRLITNMVEFAINNPGLHRFISSDPIKVAELPGSIIQTVIQIKQYFVDVMKVLSPTGTEQTRIDTIADILISYLDGETLAIINERILPGEDIEGRILKNAKLLFKLLSGHRDKPGQDLIIGNRSSYPKLNIKGENR